MNASFIEAMLPMYQRPGPAGLLPDGDSSNSNDDVEDITDERSIHLIHGGMATTFEGDLELAKKRLSELYPMLESTDALPTIWNKNDMCMTLLISHHGLRITYNPEARHKVGANNSSAASVRANNPIPPRCGLYYFEITVVHGHMGCMGVGLCDKAVGVQRLPGWDKLSYGYHGDDGNFFASCGTGQQYGPKFGTNDVVGCGVNLIDRVIFFTKNGEHLGNAPTELDRLDGLYPTIGLQAPGEVIDVNFGQVDFRYRIEDDMEKLKMRVGAQIIDTQLPTEKNDWMREVVVSWLHIEGYSGTLEAFKKASNYCTQGNEEDNLTISRRRCIMDHIMNRQTREAMKAIDEFFPKLLETNPLISLIMSAQQFVEHARDLAGWQRKRPTPRPRLKYANGNSATKKPLMLDTDAPCSSHHFTGYTIASPSELPSRSTSNPYKRTHSFASQSMASGDSDQPPVRRSPRFARTSDAPIVLDTDEPCSSRNGNSGNGMASQQQQQTHYDSDDDCGLEKDDDSEISDLSDEEEYEADELQDDEKTAYLDVISHAQSIHTLSQQVTMDSKVEKFVNRALSDLSSGSKDDFRGHPLLKRSHMKYIARCVNRAMLEYQTMAVTSDMEKLMHSWEQKKTMLLEAQCPIAGYMKVNKVVFDVDGDVSESEDDYDDGMYSSSEDDTDEEGSSPESSSEKSGEELSDQMFDTGGSTDGSDDTDSSEKNDEEDVEPMDETPAPLPGLVSA